MEKANDISCDRAEFISELMKLEKKDSPSMVIDHYQFNFDDGLSLRVRFGSSRQKCLVMFEL